MKSIADGTPFRPTACVAAALIVAAVSIVGCATTRGHWKQASTLNTIGAYEDFLRCHPESESAAAAGRRIEVLKFEEACDRNEVAIYETFLSAYPSSEMRDTVEDLLDQKLAALRGIAMRVLDLQLETELDTQDIEVSLTGIASFQLSFDGRSAVATNPLLRRVRVGKSNRFDTLLRTSVCEALQDLDIRLLQSSQSEEEPLGLGHAPHRGKRTRNVDERGASGDGVLTVGPPTVKSVEVTQFMSIGNASFGYDVPVRLHHKTAGLIFDTVIAGPQQSEPLQEGDASELIRKASGLLREHQTAEALRFGLQLLFARYFGPNRYTRALIGCLKSRNANHKVLAVQLLRTTPNACSVLVRVLEDSSTSARVAACEALGEIGDTAVVASLCGMLVSKDADTVVIAAAAALAELGDKRACRPLIRSLGEPSPDVRRAVLIALSKLGEPQWQELLLKKPSGGYYACLAEIDDIRVVDALIRALELADRVQPFDRAAITAALIRITGQDFGEDPEAWSNWWKLSRGAYR